jgi:pimeloyl-ACP methyl ester carboxylesterase
MHAIAMSVLGRRLRARGFRPIGFSYSSVRRTLDENADALWRACERIAGPTVHFVGHSLGGIVILRMMRKHAWQRPGRIVALGSPFLGSAVALHRSQRPLGRRFIGPAMAEAAFGSEVIPWTGPQPIGVIAGTTPFGIGRLLGPLTTPHDGTVMVEETRLPGAAAHRAVRATHTALLFSRDVADLAANFLEQGRFDRWTR